MQYLNVVFVALTAVTAVVALPAELPRAADDCAYEQLKRNQSNSFAWQLAGAALGNEELDSTCNNLKSGGYQKWAQEGLVLPNIQKIVCDEGTKQPNATLALPNVVASNTKIYTTLLTNAFSASNTTTWNFLCNNLRYIQLTGFLLDDATIINATCNAGNDLLSPQPFSPLAQINETAVHAYQNAASRLYALQYASAATSEEDLNRWCAHAPEYRSNWKALQFNATLVEETLCNVKQPFSADAGAAAIKQWTSRQFTVVIENISNVAGWKKWLCDNLDVSEMNAVGLDGKLVKGTVCSHVQKPLDGGLTSY